MADCLLGSPGIYGGKGREAEESINFVACHDGFTLNDVTAYNCGFEGQTDDLEIEKLRNRQVKNFFTATILSVGVPMFAMGDEVRRTQQGNNNAYCQDNTTSWFDWTLVSKHADVLRFVKGLIERRVVRDVEHERRRLSLSQVLHASSYAWHGVKLNKPNWAPFSHSLSISGELRNEAMFAHIIFNAYWEPLEFELPILEDASQRWSRWIDTALDPPYEICEWNGEELVRELTYSVGARSVVVLIANKAVNG
jgi:glycogen operon protein